VNGLMWFKLPLIRAKMRNSQDSVNEAKWNYGDIPCVNNLYLTLLSEWEPLVVSEIDLTFTQYLPIQY